MRIPAWVAGMGMLLGLIKLYGIGGNWYAKFVWGWEGRLCWGLWLSGVRGGLTGLECTFESSQVPADFLDRFEQKLHERLAYPESELDEAIEFCRKVQQAGTASFA